MWVQYAADQTVWHRIRIPATMLERPMSKALKVKPGQQWRRKDVRYARALRHLPRKVHTPWLTLLVKLTQQNIRKAVTVRSLFY